MGKDNSGNKEDGKTRRKTTKRRLRSEVTVPQQQLPLTPKSKQRKLETPVKRTVIVNDQNDANNSQDSNNNATVAENKQKAPSSKGNNANFKVQINNSQKGVRSSSKSKERQSKSPKKGGKEYLASDIHTEVATGDVHDMNEEEELDYEDDYDHDQESERSDEDDYLSSRSNSPDREDVDSDMQFNRS